MRVCKVCGQSYTTSGYKYCSDKCRDAAYKEIMKVHNAKNSPGCLTICIDCGKDIEVPHSNRKRCFACQKEANRQSQRKYVERYKAKTATRYRPFFITKSSFGERSKMPSIAEANRKANELGISYAEYIATL